MRNCDLSDNTVLEKSLPPSIRVRSHDPLCTVWGGQSMSAWVGLYDFFTNSLKASTVVREFCIQQIWGDLAFTLRPHDLDRLQRPHDPQFKRSSERKSELALLNPLMSCHHM